MEINGLVNNRTQRPKHLYSVHFDIVHGCQLRCVGCPNSTLEPKIHWISVEDFARCLGNIDVERIHTFRLFNYGEPLLYVDADGTVVPGCAHPRAGVLGNLNTQKYSQVLNSPARRMMKQAMQENRAAMPVCGSCEIGTVGNEGPLFESEIVYWNADKEKLGDG